MARLARAGIESKLFGQPSVAIRVGRYEILDELGTGGMGVVYRARDPELDREVALKLLRPEGTTKHDPDTARARLVREARAMARLSHPNVLTVHEVGMFEDQVFVAMEYVEGRTLSEWLAEAERPWIEALHKFMAAGRGLAAAHDKGIVHRDFKPENVMVSADGRVLVLDFGLARSADAPAPEHESPPVADTRFDASLTLAGALVGTPAYMSPELYAGGSADARSDQFAFCVALWEAVYRQRPFLGDSLAALAHAVMAGDIASPIGVGARPSWLRRVLEQGLAVDPAARHPSMHTLLHELAVGLAPRWHQRWMPAVVGGLAFAVGIALMATASREPTATRSVGPPAASASPMSARTPEQEPPPTEPRATVRPASHHRDDMPRDTTAIGSHDTAAHDGDDETSAADRAEGDEAHARTSIRPQVRRQPASGRKTRRHAWCYVREGNNTPVRTPTASLQTTVNDAAGCSTCYAAPDPDGLRKRVSQRDCEHYAICYEDTCP